MSHFAVLVIGENPELQLAPFHEFECTGIDNKYVQDIDITDEVKEEYNSSTRKYILLPTRELVPWWSDRFFHEPNEREKQITDSVGGFGVSYGIIFDSRDWKDGRGYRTKVHRIPEGAREVKIPTHLLMDFSEFLEENYDYNIINASDGEPSTVGENKYGYAIITADNVIKVIKRTNPNSKWDWYVLGGRWKGSLPLKSGKHSNQARVRDIDRESFQNESPLTPAVVKDSQWYERGEMGWWGITHNEKDKTDWRMEFNSLIDNLSPDTLLSVYDCHT